jgi:hypothetical protein
MGFVSLGFLLCNSWPFRLTYVLSEFISSVGQFECICILILGVGSVQSNTSRQHCRTGTEVIFIVCILWSDELVVRLIDFFLLCYFFFQLCLDCYVVQPSQLQHAIMLYRDDVDLFHKFLSMDL